MNQPISPYKSKSGPDNSDPDFFSPRFPSFDCQASGE